MFTNAIILEPPKDISISWIIFIGAAFVVK